MITQIQYERLPELARSIVDFDRAIKSEKAAAVTDAKFYRALLTQRGVLAKAAARTWGVPSRDDGTARS